MVWTHYEEEKRSHQRSNNRQDYIDGRQQRGRPRVRGADDIQKANIKLNIYDDRIQWKRQIEQAMEDF